MASSIIKRLLLWRPSSHPRHFSQKMPLLFNSIEDIKNKEPESLPDLDQQLKSKGVAGYLLGWQFVCYNCPPEKRVTETFDTVHGMKTHGREHVGCLMECEFCFSRFIPKRFYKHDKSRECFYDRVAYLESVGQELVYKSILKFKRQGARVGICVCCGQTEFHYENYRCANKKCGYSLPPPTRRK